MIRSPSYFLVKKQSDGIILNRIIHILFYSVIFFFMIHMHYEMPKFRSMPHSLEFLSYRVDVGTMASIFDTMASKSERIVHTLLTRSFSLCSPELYQAPLTVQLSETRRFERQLRLSVMSELQQTFAAAISLTEKVLLRGKIFAATEGALNSTG